MFTQLKLKNFKAWQDTGDIELAPVNLLLGTNSSGKSTLIQSLLLLKQTIASPDRTIHLNMGGDDTNDYFSFGHFDDVLTKGTTGDDRKFELSYRMKQVKKLKDEELEHEELQEWCASYVMNAARAVQIDKLEMSTDGHKFRAVRRDKGSYYVFYGDETTTRAKGRNMAPERSIALSADAIAALGHEGQIASDLSLSIRRQLESVLYLGPLRQKPQRDYLWNKSKPGEMGLDGHKAIEVLLANQHSKEDHHDIVNGVSGWLKKMGLAEKLELKQLTSTRYEVLIHRDGIVSNLRDVGIGVSQVLPVLTLAYFAPKNATILLEEPEIHLHPLAQSVLAEMFVEVSKQRSVQFIIETHSEHLFRRMQTLIAKQHTSTNDCKMYFVEREKGMAKMRELCVDDFGRVNNWPDKFFGDALGETREQTALAIKRAKELRASDNNVPS